MTQPSAEPVVSSDVAAGRRRRATRTWTRRLLPIVPVVVAGVVFVVLLQRESPSVTDRSDVTQVDVDEISTAELEELLSTYRDDAEFTDEIPGVQLVLAERYFTDGAYDRAFALYAGIVEHPATRPKQFAVSLSRLAWIGWLSNADTGQALSTLDQSLRIDPANAETVYIKGQILWCGAGDATEAIALFETVLRAPDLPDEVRAQVTGDLDAARSGTPCR